MKYKDIDLKTARKCCKQHSYKNKKGETITKCETCPLERTGKNHDRHLFCWYIVKQLYEEYDLEDNCTLKQEYDELLEEDIDKILEWENWINSQETVE